MAYTSLRSYVSRVYDQYNDFLDGHGSLTQKLLRHGYVAPRLKSSPQKFNSRPHNLVARFTDEDLFLWSCGVNKNQAVCFLRLEIVIQGNLPFYAEKTTDWKIDNVTCVIKRDMNCWPYLYCVPSCSCSRDWRVSRFPLLAVPSVFFPHPLCILFSSDSILNLRNKSSSWVCLVAFSDFL